MPSALITTWSDYDHAVQEVLQKANRMLLIFDRNLESLGLERSPRLAELRRLLHVRPRACLIFVVQSADFVCRHSPHLLALLTHFAPALTVTQAPAHLSTLRESMLIADDEHALVRFEQEQPRSRLIIGDSALCAPYRQRLDEIIAEGGDPVSPRTLGL